MTAPTLLVTGASGHLGQRVLRHLIDTLKVSPGRIIATTRNADRLAIWASRGVSVRSASFDDEASMFRAFRGAQRVLLISTDAELPGQRIEQHRHAIAAAESAGVEHVVYTSMPEPKRSLVLFAPDHADTEAALQASELAGWTVLRNHWYFENMLMLLPGVLARGGKWFSAAGDGRIADIARDDLALAAARELVGSSDGKTVHTLSGGEALTTVEQARLISATVGRPIQVIPVSPEDLLRGLVGAGVPEQFALLLVSFDVNVAAGHMGNVSGAFAQITGRRPQAFADWLIANEAALAAH